MNSKHILILGKAKDAAKSAAMKHPDVPGAGAKKRKHLKGKKKFDVVMAEFERGTLRDSHGKVVTDPDQAVAIAYSESGQGKKPKKKSK